jgi:uncharacterized protein YutE (UPF0331/DUF86 family)
VAEGALRLLARREGVSLSRLDPASIISELAVQGLVEREDYALLQAAVRARNALVHGLSSEDVTPAMAEQLAAMVERLLGEPDRHD